MPRSQFHHVNDVVPTIYDVIGIEAPKEVDGVTQQPMDGISTADELARQGAKPHQTSGITLLRHNGGHARLLTLVQD
jgi:arylsulfatase